MAVLAPMAPALILASRLSTIARQSLTVMSRKHLTLRSVRTGFTWFRIRGSSCLAGNFRQIRVRSFRKAGGRINGDDHTVASIRPSHLEPPQCAQKIRAQKT